MSAIRSDQDENGTQDAKVSDSGYSNSRNSQSQRSTGSSESRHSSSSGSSSGYGGHQSNLTAISNERKEKDVKKKKSSSSTLVNNAVVGSVEKTEGESSSQQESAKASTEQATIQPVCQVPEGLSPLTPGTNESEAIQIATLTQTLTFIKKLKHKDGDVELNQSRLKLDDRTQEQILTCLQQQQDSVKCQEEMQIVVSMEDGVVLYTCSNLTEVLGFPKDMWVGRSLIDFVHPKHRISFASHITSVIANSDFSGERKKGSKGFFCCLRSYRGLKSVGFSVTDKRVTYVPCHMSIEVRELDPTRREGMLLIITTTPIRSAYKYPEECKVSPKFTMRHCSSTLISDVDPEVVQYLGFLPQDLVGQSVLGFYHPDDLSLIKQIYQSVMKEQRQPLRSRPYRFLCQNGGYVLLETEWSAFVNPWSRKLEFLIGQHTVLKGPVYPDVTTPVDLEQPTMSEELMKEINKLHEDIKCILAATVGSSTETAKQQVSKRCKDLAMFMETLMDEITKPPDLKVDVHMDDDKSISERDSVMLGEISPHHEYYDSKSSSETPPSYNQLNYKENLQRFFESQPKTTLSDESVESKGDGRLEGINSGDTNGAAGNNQKDSSSADSNIKADNWSANNKSSTEGSGGESSSSGGKGDTNAIRPMPVGGQVLLKTTALLPKPPLIGHQIHLKTSTPPANQSVAQNIITVAASTSAVNRSGRPVRYTAPHLTEKLLNKHNEDMEKQMVQRHREQRCKTGDGKNKEKHKSNFDKYQDEICHGLKRSGSHSFEGEPYKSIKASHQPTESSSQVVGPLSTALPNQQATSTGWPPFATAAAAAAANVAARNSMTNGVLNGATAISAGLGGAGSCAQPALMSPLLPMYYIQQQQQMQQQDCRIVSDPNPSMHHIHPFMPAPQGPGYMPGMLYQPIAMLGSPAPMLYSPLTVLPTPVFPPQPPMKPPRPQLPQQCTRCDGDVRRRPGSEATSVKAQPGSIATSTSNIQTLSEQCKSNSQQKIAESDSYGTSNVYDDSSFYSSFGSFPFKKTDNSDESMKSSVENDGKSEDMFWEKSDGRNHGSPKIRPVRMVAPWMEEVTITPELTLKYQLKERGLEDLLKGDSAALEKITQPSLVNDQLCQMYLDLELEGLSKSLTLDEGITSSGSDSSPDDSKGSKSSDPLPGTSSSSKYSHQISDKRKKKRYMAYEKMSILYEENAPMPPPLVQPLPT